MKHFYRTLVLLGMLLLLVAGGTFVTVSYLNSRERGTPLIFSNNAMLLELYNDYKKQDIDKSSGRTIDKSQNNITTSEGQSYTMLRSVWMDDKATFDSSWKFAKNNLQRPDKLFSWKYGKLPNGQYGILASQGGTNTASDGDSDIALALLMAYSRWNDKTYLTEAQAVVSSIWQNEVVSVAGKPVLTADDLEKNSTTDVVVNPSYFSPYAYRIFDKVDADKTHDWGGLITNSYDILARLSDNKLDKNASNGLPPDWVRINRDSGEFLPPGGNLTTNYSYDAIRVPFRLALDYKWYHDGRAKLILNRFGFLKQFWDNAGVLNASYGHDGKVIANYEAPAIYGASLGYFQVVHPGTAKEIYKSKLQTLYSPDQQAWKAPAPSYYDDNWAWFGIALYQDALPNLTEKN